jgi:hypothetical protein
VDTVEKDDEHWAVGIIDSTADAIIKTAPALQSSWLGTLLTIAIMFSGTFCAATLITVWKSPEVLQSLPMPMMNETETK